MITNTNTLTPTESKLFDTLLIENENTLLTLVLQILENKIHSLIEAKAFLEVIEYVNIMNKFAINRIGNAPLSNSPIGV